MKFSELLRAAKILKANGWTRVHRQLYLDSCLLSPICPSCEAHRLNYLISMKSTCAEDAREKHMI